MALLFALACPELSIEGLTIVMGNHFDVDLLATNAKKIVQVSGIQLPPHVKIYKGATKPLENADWQCNGGLIFHGQNGLGDIPPEEYLPKLPGDISISDIHASDFIIDTCMKYPGEVTLILLGPLTNVAIALKKRPDLSKYVKKIVSMGGVFKIQGNTGLLCEANISNDPQGARVVFQSGIPIELTPLDLTHSIFTDTPFRNELKSIGKIGKFIYDITTCYIKAYESHGTSSEHIPTHDPCAIMAVVNPSVFTKAVQAFVDVETKGELTMGATVADYIGFLRKKPQTTIYMESNEALFKQFYVSRIALLPNKV